MINWGPTCINTMLGGYTAPCLNTDNMCTFQYHREVLAGKIISQFVFDMPDTWPEIYPLQVILCGWMAVVNDDKYGKIPINATLEGEGIWKEPTSVLVAEPLVHYPEPLRIGSKAGVVRMSPMYVGAAPIINHYAELLTLADNAIYANLVNSRIGHVFTASSSGVAKAVIKAFDGIILGKPFVVDTKVKEDLDGDALSMLGEPGKHVITDKLLENKRTIMRDFCRDVGIPTGNETKRERLTTSEVEVNDQETERLLSFWLRHLKSSMEATNRLFDLNLGVKLDGNYIGRDSKNPPDTVDGI